MNLSKLVEIMIYVMALLLLTSLSYSMITDKNNMSFCEKAHEGCDLLKCKAEYNNRYDTSYNNCLLEEIRDGMV